MVWINVRLGADICRREIKTRTKVGDWLINLCPTFALAYSIK